MSQWQSKLSTKRHTTLMIIGHVCKYIKTRDGATVDMELVDCSQKSQSIQTATQKATVARVNKVLASLILFAVHVTETCVHPVSRARRNTVQRSELVLYHIPTEEALTFASDV